MLGGLHNGKPYHIFPGMFLLTTNMIMETLQNYLGGGYNNVGATNKEYQQEN